MPADVFSIAVAGFRSATVRLAVSAHNVSLLNVPGARSLRAEQRALPEGGSAVEVFPSAQPEPVDPVHEFVEQIRARFQARASLLVVGNAQKTHGRLIDLVA